MAEVYGSPRPRKRWGRRLLITFLVLLILLLGLLVVLDRVAASIAERMLADKVTEQVANQQATSQEPQVAVEGIPFLTQVVRGEYQEIKIELRDLAGPAGNGKTIKLPLLDVRAKQVQAPLEALRNGTGTIVAKTVTGEGTIDYATVQGLIEQQGVKLGAKDGKLTVTAPVKILNQQVTVNGTAELTVKDNIVSVRFNEVSSDALPQVPIAQTLLNNYAKSISFNFPIPPLPLKLAVQKVTPTNAGLVVTASASDVQFNAGGL